MAATLAGELSSASESDGMELGSSAGPEEAGMELEGGVRGDVSVVGVWFEVQEVLSGVLCAEVDERPEVDWLGLTDSALGGDSSKEGGEGGRDQVILGMMMKKILSVLSCILRVASCDDLEGIVKGLEEQVSERRHALSYCMCWRMLLGSRLSQEQRATLRPSLAKVSPSLYPPVMVPSLSHAEGGGRLPVHGQAPPSPRCHGGRGGGSCDVGPSAAWSAQGCPRADGSPALLPPSSPWQP